MAAIRSWYPNFASNGNFEELKGWDVILRQIFTVLVTRPGTRQWQPEFGCTLIDQLFEIDVSNDKLNNIIKNAFRWLPHVNLIDVNCQIKQLPTRTGNRAYVDLKVEYNGETKDVNFEFPDSMDLLNGAIHQIKVRRK